MLILFFFLISSGIISEFKYISDIYTKFYNTLIYLSWSDFFNLFINKDIYEIYIKFGFNMALI